ncbi:hypothetical protein M9Y10_031073 [Tritrichomonas musculus]|uniref:Calpain catalytic domain-containing protein n=1 Tax=Tritrichomonas musculus TaxID=1915356 RepID=A0ABR2H1V2_9EUKA
MGMEDFDSRKFTIISVPFAIAIAVVLLLWFLINHFRFKWRPALIGPAVVAHSIKSTPKSCGTILLLIIYWIFFLLPFLLFLAWGGLVAYFFEPYYLGVVIGLGPTAILLIMYIYLDYSYRGFIKKGLSKFGLIICFLAILAITFCSVYLLDRQTWIEMAYLFAFPPSLFFMLSYTYSHSYIPNDVIEYALEGEDKMNEFIDQLSNHDKTCFKGSKKLNFWWSLANVLFSLACNFLYQFNYWYKDRNNEKGERDAAFYTAVGFFLIDFLLLLAQVGTKIRPSFFIIIFLGYIVKVVAISFTTQYWITGHGVVIFFLSSFLLIRFILGFWKPIPAADLRNSDQNELVHELSSIMNKSRKMPKVTVVCSFISWIIVVAACLAELVFQRKNDFKILPFGNMTQINALLALGVLSIPFALLICTCLYLYNNCGFMTLGTYIMYFLSIGILILFDVIWQGAKNLLLLRLLVPVVFIFVSSCLCFLLMLYYQKSESFKIRSYLVPFIIYFLITVISLLLSIALPYGCQKYFKQEYNTVTKLSGLMVVLVVLIFLFYSFFVISFLRENSMKNVKTIIAFILSILFVAALGVCTGKLFTGIIVFCSVMVIFCLAFAFSYTKHNDWTFSLAPYLVIAIPSLIILVLAIFALFKIKDDQMMFYVSFLAFAFAFIFFGSSLFFWLQKKNFYFNWASIFCLILLILSALAVIGFIAYKYRQAFVVFSVVLLTIFIASLLGMLCFILSQSIANVIVVSDVFFPIRRLVNGRIKTIGMFNVLYCLAFMSCWFWGLFGSVFFDNHPDFGPLASTGAILLIGFITCFFITQFDSNTYTSLQYIQKEEIEYAVNTAMGASNISIELVNLEEPDQNDYEAFMNYVDQKIASNSNVSLFLSALKAELFVSSDVAFRSARNKVHHYFHELDYTDEELIFLTYETGWSNSEKLKVYALLRDIRESNPEQVQKEDNFNNKLKKQIENRLKVKAKHETTDTSAYQKLVSRHEQNNDLYEDPDYNETTDTASFSFKVPWRRMEEVYPSQMLDGSRRYNANIIKQGAIGDCYLISAMVSISKNPKLLLKLLSDPVNNNAGVRCVNFHFMGKIVPVIVDTKIPFRGSSESSNPYACMPVNRDDQWWAPIVEKAYAKYYGSYQAIDGGNSHVALYRMIGGFPIRYDMQDMKTKEMVQNGTMWKMLLKWYQEGNFLCTGSNAGSDTDTNPQGIVYGHAYTILQVVEIFGNKLIQLRNPWGNGEWTGDWSDKSPKWTQKLKSALNFQDEEDGIFWMCFNDFVNNYRSIYASINIDNKYHYTLDGVFNPDENDGASPFSNGETDATHLVQYVIRSKSTDMQPTLYGILEKTGGSCYSNVLVAYNKGEKLKYIYSGTKFGQFGMPTTSPLISFQWLYDEPQNPINLMVFRNKFSESTNWHLELFCDAELEITKLE